MRSLLLFLLLCACPSADEPPPRACNGHAALCDRALDGVVFLRTHNSMSSEERGYHIWSRNHTFAVPTQLDDGVRAFNLDVYEEEGELILYHGFRDLGWQPFDEALSEFSDWLAEHPDEVVTIDFQQEASVESTAAALQAHPLTDLVHTHASGEPWPTLSELIDAGERVVIATSGVSGDPAWLHDKNQLMYGDRTQAETTDDLGCAIDPPPADHALLQLNNVLTDPIASPDLADQANTNPFMIDRIDGCVAEWGRLPSQISVDYYSRGDSLENVDRLNGVGAFAPE